MANSMGNKNIVEECLNESEYIHVETGNVCDDAASIPTESDTQNWAYTWFPAYVAGPLTAIIYVYNLLFPNGIVKALEFYFRSLLLFMRLGYNMHNDQICVVGRNKSYVLSTAKEIKRLELRNIKVSQKHLTCNPQCSCSLENFDGAHFIIIVATADPGMMLISDTGQSQIGNIYKRAKSTGTSILILLAGHRESDCMKECELYAPSLQGLCSNQKEIGAIAAEGGFFSCGFVHNPTALKFNLTQRKQIKKWVGDKHDDDK